MILIVKKGAPEKNQKLKFPPIEKIVSIFGEISNEDQYYVANMADLDYEMPESDRVGTQLIGGSNLFSQQTSNPATKRKTANIDEALSELKP